MTYYDHLLSLVKTVIEGFPSTAGQRWLVHRYDLVTKRIASWQKVSKLQVFIDGYSQGLLEGLNRLIETGEVAGIPEACAEAIEELLAQTESMACDCVDLTSDLLHAPPLMHGVAAHADDPMPMAA